MNKLILLCTAILAVVVVGTASAASIWGSNGVNDTLYGTISPDTFLPGSGDDLLWGIDGGDTMPGDQGADRIHGELGNDDIRAGCINGCGDFTSNRDQLFGEGGNDLLAAANGKADTLDGGSGTDTCYYDQIYDSVSNCEVLHPSYP